MKTLRRALTADALARELCALAANMDATADNMAYHGGFGGRTFHHSAQLHGAAGIVRNWAEKIAGKKEAHENTTTRKGNGPRRRRRG